MKLIYRAAVTQWTKRLTRTGETRVVRIREAHIFDITKCYSSILSFFLTIQYKRSNYNSNYKFTLILTFHRV